MSQKKDVARKALEIPARLTPSSYPEPFYSHMQGRTKRPLGDAFGLQTFGVNLTTLAAGSESSIFHRHTKQEEFIYILEGQATLITEEGETLLDAGMCAGFTPSGGAHQLVNRSISDVIYLEIGTRVTGDEVVYPRDDLKAVLGADGKWVYTRKDGTPY